MHTTAKFMLFLHKHVERKSSVKGCLYYWKLCYASDQGSPNFLFKGHISSYTTVHGPDILCNVIASGYVTFCQIKKFFVISHFSPLTKFFCRPDFACGTQFGGPCLRQNILTYDFLSSK